LEKDDGLLLSLDFLEKMDELWLLPPPDLRENALEMV
jgi:hypothetical protein